MLSSSFQGEVAMNVFGLAVLAPTCLFSYLISSGDNSIAIVANILFYTSATAIYLFPSIYTALVEPAPPRRIFIINLLAGWTLIGWWAAYQLAMCYPQSQPVE
ncbi:superinfection immunity protein [Pseudomonas sp. P867]|nr:superinfection immunity protein [Pseudomonas sp. P867]